MAPKQRLSEELARLSPRAMAPARVVAFWCLLGAALADRGGRAVAVGGIDLPGSARLGRGSGRNDDDGAWGMVAHLMAHRTQEEP